MKRIKFFTQALFCCSILFLIGCDKFPLIKDGNIEGEIAGQNLKSMTLWEYVSADDFHADDFTDIGMFGKALQRAGLVDLLNKAGDNYTVILPRDNAFTSYLTLNGYASLEAVPVPVLRNLLLNLIFQTRFHGYDTDVNTTRTFPTLNGDTMSISREDPYELFINKPAYNVSVRSQNLEFNNAIAHVIDAFPYSQPIKTTPDVVDPNAVTYLKDTIYVQKNCYVTYGTGANSNYYTASKLNLLTKNAGATANSTRRIYFQYPVRAAKFSGRIGSVTAFYYCHYTDGTITANVYKDQDADWIPTTITANNAPIRGGIILGGFTVPLVNGIDKWYSAPVTPGYVASLSDGKQFINLGLMLAVNNLLQFKPIEANGGIYKSFLEVKSPPATILKNAVVNTMIADRQIGIKTLKTNELKVTGTADKNISFIVTVVPQSGYLVLNGIPLAVNASFTQEQVAKGAVKYLCSDNPPSANDSFSVEAQDFQGGYYPQILTVPIQIN